MKISDVIEHLQQIKEEHGDIEVVTWDDFEGTTIPVTAEDFTLTSTKDALMI